MAQVITPPTKGQQEDQGKNWYRAETLKRLLLELNAVLREAPDNKAKIKLDAGIDLIESARQLYMPK